MGEGVHLAAIGPKAGCFFLIGQVLFTVVIQVACKRPAAPLNCAIEGGAGGKREGRSTPPESATWITSSSSAPVCRTMDRVKSDKLEKL